MASVDGSCRLSPFHVLWWYWYGQMRMLTAEGINKEDVVSTLEHQHIHSNSKPVNGLPMNAKPFVYDKA